jgi:hypothetical protein
LASLPAAALPWVEWRVLLVLGRLEVSFSSKPTDKSLSATAAGVTTGSAGRAAVIAKKEKRKKK